MRPLYGGVETGGTWCVCAIGSGPSEVERIERFPTTAPAETIARIVEFLASEPRPIAVGIGSFGPVDVDPLSPGWGSVTTTPKPGWQNVSIARVLQDALALPVAFDHDVVVAALGEYRWGAGRDVAALSYVTVGTGIGAGLLIDGRPWHGLQPPEVGHIRIPHDRERDPFPGACPFHGDCWEGLASGGAIEARWGAPGAALDDDHAAWELEAEYIALGLLSIVGAISPQRVVLGGGVMDHPGLLDRVRSKLRGLIGGYLATPLLNEHIDRFLVAPGLGDDAGVMGAIALAQALTRDGTPA